MANKNYILRLSDLSIGYCSKKRRNIVAKNINVSLERGKLVSILGKNGIGKSTLLRTIAKIQKKIDGEIILNNINLDNYSSNKLAKKISLVLTEQIPTGNLTVYELIALGRQPYTNWLGVLTNEDRKQIDLAIQKTNLKDLLNFRCDELSDGQLQRVMICRAVAQDTSLIILDEPTAHLDIQNKMITFKLLQQLAYELGKTILISTHEAQLAIQLSDQLWLMTQEGLIDGDPKSVVKNDIINKIFDPNVVRFDKKTNQFLVIK
jgi:iron complex transport system ATP-binding protein